MTNSFDDSNWDSPLNRTSESRTTFRILKHSYAVRDQCVQVEINCIQGGVRFSNTNDYHDLQISTDHKRMYHHQEKKPLIQPVPDNRYSVSERNNTSKDTIKTKPKTTKPLNQTNPIYELQSKGKQYQSTYGDKDDPPFNFQAILKKTNYKHPSVDGRNVQYSSETPDGSVGGRRDSGKIAMMDRTYSKTEKQDMIKQTNYYVQPNVDNVKQSKDFKNELNHQLSNSMRTELLPGIMIEGSSYDL